jgi:broad specificity phosphatase PhoE
LAAHEGQTVLLASHCAILQVLLCQALRMDLAGRWRFRLDPAALSELILAPNGNSISYINDRPHLRGLGVEAPAPILAER